MARVDHRAYRLALRLSQRPPARQGTRALGQRGVRQLPRVLAEADGGAADRPDLEQTVGRIERRPLQRVASPPGLSEGLFLFHSAIPPITPRLCPHINIRLRAERRSVGVHLANPRRTGHFLRWRVTPDGFGRLEPVPAVPTRLGTYPRVRLRDGRHRRGRAGAAPEAAGTHRIPTGTGAREPVAVHLRRHLPHRRHRSSAPCCRAEPQCLEQRSLVCIESSSAWRSSLQVRRHDMQDTISSGRSTATISSSTPRSSAPTQTSRGSKPGTAGTRVGSTWFMTNMACPLPIR